MSLVRRRAGRLLVRPRLLALDDRIAPAGGLDPAFGTGGVVNFNFGAADGSNTSILQSDGKILVAGSTSNGYPDTDFALARFLPDGSLDTSFGTGGRIRTSMSGLYDAISNFVVQGDGKIVAAGTVNIGQNQNVLGLVRYNPNGSLDAAFGVNGLVFASYGTRPALTALLAQPGGKLLVVGSSTLGSYLGPFLARFNADGSLDTSFGTNGFRNINVDGDFRQAVVQPDGKILAGGYPRDNSPRIFLCRFHSDGTLDPTFDGDGQRTVDFPNLQSAWLHDLALQSDGRIVVCGSGFGSSMGMVARFLPNGATDPTFDGDGVATHSASNSSSDDSVVVLADGRIVVVGFLYPTSSVSTAHVTRFNAGGTLDQTFGSNGTIIVAGSMESTYDAFSHVFVQPDCNVVATGGTYSPSGGGNFLLARFVPGGSVIVAPQATLATTEAGATVQFSVVLSQVPSTDVTIALSPPVAGEGMLSATTLTFTPANALTPQVVTVTGLDDPYDDGDVTYTIRIGPAATADPEFANVRGADVVVTNIDDDTASIAATPTAGLVTTEAGGTATFTVRLTCTPRADVVVALSSGTPTEGGPTVPSITFTPANWQTPQTVTVIGVDDLIDDDDVPFAVGIGRALSNDPAYDGMLGPVVTVLNIDNDTAAIEVVAASPLETTEAGGTATFTVRLLTIPRNTVTLPVSSSDTTEGTVAPASVTFLANATALTPQTVTVTGVNDFLIDGDIYYTVVLAAAVSTDPKYAGMAPPDLPAVNRDNDVAGVVVTPTAGLTTTEAGGTATFTIRLTAVPAADVTIPLTSSDPTEGTVPASVTLTPANAMSGVTVTVTGVNDGIVDGPVGYTIVTGATTSADPNFAGLDPADVSVTNLDNDPIQIVGYTLNDGAAQRSSFKRFAFTFGQIVTASPTAFRVRRADGYEPALTLVHTVANGQTTVTVTFSGPGIIAGSLPDGVYGLTVFGDQVLDAFAQPLDGDGDGQPSGDFTTGFHRLFGDVNGDATVNAADFAQFRGAFGTIAGLPGYRDYLDYDGDGAISAFDFGQFRNRFGVTLP